MEGVHEQGVRAERGGDAGVQSRPGGHRGDVPLDVVPAAEQQRDEDGRLGAARVQLGERVGEQGRVELDVAQVHGQAGAQCAHPRQELPYGAQRPWVAAAVRHDDESGWVHGVRRHAPIVGAGRCRPVARG